MSDLSPRERGLLVALRSEDEPTREDRARVRAALATRIALAGGAVGLSAAAAKTAAAANTASATTGAGLGSLGALFSWKVGVAVVALTAAGAGGAAYVSGAGSHEVGPAPVPPAVAQVAAVSPSTAEGTAEAAVNAAAPSDTTADAPSQQAPAGDLAPGAAVERPSAPAAARAPSSAKPSAPDDAARAEKELQEELALMTEAQRSLKEGDSKGALSALDKHAAEHPKGTLAIERDGVRAIALCESGKVAAGQAAAKRFLAKNPKSVLAARIRAACF